MISSGTHAFALALQLAEIASGDEVLVPAFNCPSMIEPIYWTTAKPVYIKIKHDLTLDLDDIEKKITTKSKAILAPYFFGFPQKMKALKALCDAYNILLIEDCAHAYFGGTKGEPFGSYGDFAIASARKFFPCNDGGALISSTKEICNIKLVESHFGENIKCLFNIFEEALEYKRFPYARYFIRIPIQMKNIIWGKLKTRRQRQESCDGSSSTQEHFVYMCPDTYMKKISLPSKLVIHFADKNRIICKRRTNYKKIVQELCNIPNGKPLFMELTDDIVPYMVPFILEKPHLHFNKLKMEGVPIWRWEESAIGYCANTDNYAFNLLQLPCHQELTHQEITWMIDKIKKILGNNINSNRGSHAVDM